MAKRKHSEIGSRWGRLVIIGEEPRDIAGKKVWLCRCDCGTVKVIAQKPMHCGGTTSCGCYAKERFVKRITKHGFARHKLYKIWTGMKQRCYNQKNEFYYLYGGNGVVVCNEWLEDFTLFYNWATKNGWHSKLSIDRIDGAKIYSPSTCRLATPTMQARNVARHRGSNSIYIGVHHLTSGNWLASIGIARKTYNIGTFKTELEAAQKRDQYIIDNNLEHYRLNF